MASDVEKFLSKWDWLVPGRLIDEFEAGLKALAQPAASGEVAPERCADCRHTTFEKRHDGSHICVHCKTIATPQPDADTVRDAERYRFIRANASEGTIFCCPLPGGSLNCDEPESEWDAAIDSAIKGEKS